MGNTSVRKMINIRHQNKEGTSLLWFDPNIETIDENKETKNRLRLINDYVLFHTDLDQCIRCIQSIVNEKILLITCGSRASELLSYVGQVRQIDSIFIYCMNKEKYEYLLNEYSKLIGIYVELNMLCQAICEQIDLVNKQFQAFSFFDQHQAMTKSLSKKSAEFLWFQLFNHVIRGLPRNEQAKKQMIDICRQYYRGNLKERKLIDQFEEEYQSEHAIGWYSKQSFVYKLINKALRSEDIDQLHTFRFFIGDLSESLRLEHEKMLQSNERIITVYRGTKLSFDEFEKLKENEGKLISTNGYLSTSRLHSRALQFALKPTRRADVLSVLFEIKCNLDEIGRSISFADISHLSEYPDEQEVLFDLSAAFRLEKIQKFETIYLIEMTASNEGEILTKDYLEATQRETEEKSVAIVFGRLLCNLGEYDKSQTYFEQLFNESNGEDLAWIEHNIGRALFYKGKYQEARDYYDRAYKRMMTNDPPRLKDSVYVLHNIGVILVQQGQYDQALEYHYQALQIREKDSLSSSDHIDVASSLNHIGNVLMEQGKFSEALDYYQRALHIREIYYRSTHVDIAASLICIGNVFYMQGKYDQSLDYYQRALDIQQTFYPSDHIDIALSLSNIGNIFSLQCNYNNAFDHYQKALKIREKYYPSDHIDIASSYSSLASVLFQQGQLSLALDYYQRANRIREKYYPTGHIDIATNLNNIGIILDQQGNSKDALEYYRHAWKMKQKFYPNDHREIGDSLYNMGACYEELKQLDQALDCYRYALVIYEKYLTMNDLTRLNTERNIRRLSHKCKSHINK